MFRYQFICDDSRQGDVRIRIVSNRKKCEISTGLRMSTQVFEEAMGLRTLQPANRKWYKVIQYYESRINDIKVAMIVDGITLVDLKELKKKIQEDVFGKIKVPEETVPENNFITFFERLITVKKNNGNKQVYKYALQKIKDYDRRWKSLTFDDITVKWMFRFDEYLVEKGLAQNTRTNIYKSIRSVINRAIDEEVTQTYPFRRFKLKTETTRKRAMTLEDLRKLIRYKLEPGQEIYRDMFVLTFMLIGINTIDLFGLKKVTKDGRIEYRRSKTRKLYSIKVEPEAMEIIERYKGQHGMLWICDRWSNPQDFRNYMNVRLKKIGYEVPTSKANIFKIKPEWPDITIYWARHTWATIAASLDIPKETISHALGHGNNTVTDIYIDFDQSKIDVANRRVIDWVLYGKK